MKEIYSRIITLETFINGPNDINESAMKKISKLIACKDNLKKDIDAYTYQESVKNCMLLYMMMC